VPETLELCAGIRHAIEGSITTHKETTMDYTNDADLEYAQLLNSAAHESALRKIGICTHGWRRATADGKQECLHCHKISTEQELDDERREALI
jgi:hypothetical protein